jgi:AraC family transcriptional activator of tynA and feaB
MRLLSYLGNKPADAWKSLATMSVREFYNGNLEFDPNSVPELTFDKTLAFPFSLTHMTITAPVGYSRSWEHIRNNKVGLKVIWFVKRGAVQILRSQGACTIAAGKAGILDSNAPFHARLLCDGAAPHESFQAIIPPDLFLTHLPDAERFTGAFNLDTAEGRVVQVLLSLLAEKGEQIGRDTVIPLSQSFLAAIGEAIGIRHKTDIPRRQRLVDKRLSDIEKFIELNLTDPDLSHDKVAESCGISPRYLCYVLKENGKSFSDLLWSNRLPKARDLLVSTAARHYSIREIAFMSGFKSAAHFSRQFKATYGTPPREYRAAHGISESCESAVSPKYDRDRAQPAGARVASSGPVGPAPG